jgi:hypothetical protein
VQIEYDVEVYGAEKKMQIPFVMGVMADLAGKQEDPLPSIEDKSILRSKVWTTSPQRQLPEKLPASTNYSKRESSSRISLPIWMARQGQKN